MLCCFCCCLKVLLTVEVLCEGDAVAVCLMSLQIWPDVIAEVYGLHDVVLVKRLKVLLSGVYCRIIKFLNWTAMKRRIPVGSLSGLNFVIQTVSSPQNFEDFLKT